MANYQVIVSNLGTVYDGSSMGDAEETYSQYKDIVSAPHGRASGEEVTLLLDNEVIQFFQLEKSLEEAFKDSFMKPCIYEGFYFEIDTDQGTEIIPSDVIGRTAGTDVSAFLDYLEGKPLNDAETVECKHGWLSRMSASGYTDCTPWTAHKTQEEAESYLRTNYGNEE